MELFLRLNTVKHINALRLLLICDSMGKRKYVLDPLGMFQKKLEDFFKAKQLDMEQRQQASKAYLESVYEYHLKGLSLREISKITGIPQATIHMWIKKIQKAQGQPSPSLPEASDYPKEQP